MGIIFDTREIITIEPKNHDIHCIAEAREDEPFGISVITLLHFPDTWTARGHPKTLAITNPGGGQEYHRNYSGAQMT
ncbi:MAG TPA: hypothetical protein DCP92_24540 [Nitrospiraceae bacterium]|jgi:hypothetical protein|nr:hypothetical protein [Nitrospiraceae bacterium]